MGEAEELCDRIGILLNGELIALDTADGLKRQYAVDGETPSLEEVFMRATGTTLEEAEFSKDEDGDKDKEREGAKEREAEAVAA